VWLARLSRDGRAHAGAFTAVAVGGSLPLLRPTKLHLGSRLYSSEGGNVAKKTVLVSDKSGQEIPDGKGATVRITFRDARKGVRQLDLTDAEAEALGGRAVARRGRKPKNA